MEDHTYHKGNHWEYNLLGAIIRLAIEHYNTKDKSSKDFITSEAFLFKNENVIVDNKPINHLEIYLSGTDLSADAIRKTIKRR